MIFFLNKSFLENKNTVCSCSTKTTKKDPSLLKVPREWVQSPGQRSRPSVGPGPDRPEGKSGRGASPKGGDHRTNRSPSGSGPRPLKI